MTQQSPWSFYGRQHELQQLRTILARRRWFFAQISGRRRIGKTALIQQALQHAGVARSLYIQIPDSDPTGLLSACNDYLETFGLTDRVGSFADLVQLIGRLAADGYVIVLDEFQYFTRKNLFEFCSLLQAEVDRLSARAAEVLGGLIVLGSLHAEMSALLEDRAAPLFNRTTDVLELDHLDVASVVEIVRTHADADPARLLFLWNLFEGVPKFYRDAYEQGVIGAARKEVLERLFFLSSSPLKSEADNWFLRELRGRYDTVLQYVARHPGCNNADIQVAIARVSSEEGRQVGGYVKTLTERYRMIERKLPIFSKPKARIGRYYIRDNFLRAWLAALQRPVAAVHFRPLPELLAQADAQLARTEGYALEELAGQLYEERSRRGIGDFALSHRVLGFWDRSGVDIDLVAVSEDEHRIRFGTCKRSAANLAESVPTLRDNAAVFLAHHPQYRDWTAEYCAIGVVLDAEQRGALRGVGVIPQCLDDLLDGI